jgi:hypothetical protein
VSRADLVVAGIAVLVAGSAAFVTGQSTPDPTQPQPRADVVRLDAQTLGCPESPAGPRQSASVLAVTPAGRAAGGSGVLQLVEVEDDAERPLASVDVLGEVAELEAERRLPAVGVSARGALAPGVSGAAYVEADTAERSGLEGVRCETPGDDWWFVGIDTSPAATSRLSLVNPTPAVAVVSLHFYGPRGLVPTPGSQGIPVGAGTSQVIDLAGSAPGLEWATLHVEVTRGQIAPAVHVQRFTATSALGSDWIPPAREPAREVTVSPTAPGGGSRTLLITNPRTREALVQGRLVDEDGAFVPESLTDLRVAPGQTLEVDLDELSEGSAVAVRLAANLPLVAGTVTRTAAPGGGRADLAFSASADPVGIGGAALPVPAGMDASVQLVSLRPGGGRVAVAAYTRSGDPLGDEVLSLPGAAVGDWSPPARDSDRMAYVVVTPRRATTVEAVLTVSDRAGFTTLPFVAGQRTLTVPAVQPAGP